MPDQPKRPQSLRNLLMEQKNNAIEQEQTLIDHLQDLRGCLIKSIFAFLAFAQGKVSPLLSLESYLQFMLLLVVPFGLIFNLPLLLLAAGALGLISSAKLKAWRKQAIFLCFLIGALITPTPDIFTQTAVALPMVLLYEVSIWLLKYFQ